MKGNALPILETLVLYLAIFIIGALAGIIREIIESRNKNCRLKQRQTAAVIYLLKGKDLIPDNIPVLGYVDDLSVFPATFLIDEPELATYSQRREGTTSV